ncbi:MAG: RNA polymerase sigma factor [Hyphomicrobiales bacterium]
MMQRAAKPSDAELAGRDDAQLVALARQGDEAAVRAIVRRHNRRLFRVARGVVRDDAEAEDIVQETYARAFTALANFRGTSRLSTWLTRIALNEALGRLRRRRPTAGLEEIDRQERPDGARIIMFPNASWSDNPEAQLSRSQIGALIERAIDDLPGPYRIVFVLRAVEEMSIAETAKLLALKPETVKTRLHRARAQLRTALDKKLASAFSDLFPFDGERCAHMAEKVVRHLRDRSPQGERESFF